MLNKHHDIMQVTEKTPQHTKQTDAARRASRIKALKKATSFALAFVLAINAGPSGEISRALAEQLNAVSSQQDSSASTSTDSSADGTTTDSATSQDATGDQGDATSSSDAGDQSTPTQGDSATGNEDTSAGQADTQDSPDQGDSATSTQDTSSDSEDVAQKAKEDAATEELKQFGYEIMNLNASVTCTPKLTYGNADKTTATSATDKLTLSVDPSEIWKGTHYNPVVTYPSFVWQYKDELASVDGNEAWVDIVTSTDAGYTTSKDPLKSYYKVTSTTGSSNPTSKLEITVPPADNYDYTLREMLNGREYRCVADNVTAEYDTSSMSFISQHKTISGLSATSDAQAVTIDDSLLPPQTTQSCSLSVAYGATDVPAIGEVGAQAELSATATPTFTGLTQTQTGKVTYRSFQWQYKDTSDATNVQWRAIEEDPDLAAFYHVTDPTAQDPNVSLLNIDLPDELDGTTKEQVFANRIKLNGREFRCVVTAIATVEETGEDTIPLGSYNAETPSQAVSVDQDLCIFANTKTIVKFLKNEDETSVDGPAYNPSDGAYKQIEAPYGPGQSMLKNWIPQTVKAVVVDKVGKTQTYVQDIPLSWQCDTSGKYGNYDATKAKAVYDFLSTVDIAKLKNAETDKTINWVIDGSLSGLNPFVKLGWNTEIAGLAGDDPFNVYKSNTFTAMSEADQKNYLQTNYPTVTGIVQDVWSDDVTKTKNVEVAVTWEKVQVNEYDANSHFIKEVWKTGGDEGQITGTDTPMAKWVWNAVIDQSIYSLQGELKTKAPEAIIAWSKVITKINAAADANGNSVSAFKMTSGTDSSFSTKMPVNINVDMKDPLNQSTDKNQLIPVVNGDWKIITGKYYNTSAANKWSDAAENQTLTTFMNNYKSRSAAYIQLKPELAAKGYTLIGGIDVKNATIWMQWGNIVTAIYATDGVSKLNLATIGVNAYKVIDLSAYNASQRSWNTVKNRSDFPKNIKFELLDKTVSTQPTTSVSVTWNQPTGYTPSADSGDYSSYWSTFPSGYYLSEDGWKAVGDQRPYVRLYWDAAKIVPGNSEWQYPNTSSPDYGTGFGWYCRGANFDIWGNANNGVGSDSYIKTTYGNGGYTSVYQVDSNSWFNNTYQGNPATMTSNGVTFERRIKLVNNNTLAQVRYTVTNNDSAPHKVSIATHADTMIAGTDSAAVTPTTTGFEMKDNSGNVFNMIFANSYGVTDVDWAWAGPYGQRTNNMWGIGNVRTNRPTDVTGQFIRSEVPSVGTDSGVAASWMDREIPPNSTAIFTMKFGVGNLVNPPQLSSMSASVASDGKTINCSGRYYDYSGRTDTLYYVLDYDPSTTNQENKITSLNATGNWQTLSGSFDISTQKKWTTDEFHNIAFFIMNDKGAMTKMTEVPIILKTNAAGETIMDNATPTSVYYSARGSGAGQCPGTPSGTVPSTKSTHLKETITLPYNTLSYSGYKFVGWKDRSTGKIWPAGSKFKVERANGYMDAYWVANSNIVYYVDVYEESLEDAEGHTSKELVSSNLNIGVSGGTISFNPGSKAGFNHNNSETTTSMSSVTQDNKHLTVYWKRDRHKLTYHTNYAANLSETLKTTSTALYGQKLSQYAFPTEYDLSARGNSEYFAFNGWNTDPLGKGESLSADTVITKDIDAYAQWLPQTGKVKITFDYSYQNHASGITRVDKKDLTATFVGEGHKYGYAGTVADYPNDPPTWKSTDDKNHVFMGWKVGNTIISHNYQFTEFEPVTAVAQWKDAYDVTCTHSGLGEITTNATDIGGSAQLFAEGTQAMVAWEPDTGYKVRHVYIDGVLRDDLIEAGVTVFKKINANHKVYIDFAKSDEEEAPKDVKYTITCIGTGCTFTNPESGVATVNKGDNYTVTWKPQRGYQLSQVIVGGLPQQVTGTSFTFNMIRFDQEIEVTYTRMDGLPTDMPDDPRTFNIQTSIKGGTSITPSTTAQEGTSKTISWEIPYGYKLDQVLVNKVALPTLPSGNSYTFTRIIQDYTLDVICVRDPNIPIPPKTYVVETSIKNGTITRTSDVGEITEGTNYTVSWQPLEGYYVASIKIDGELQGKTVDGEFKPSVFYEKKFENITDNHSVEVVCELIPVTPPEPAKYKISTEIENGGTIDTLDDVKEGDDATVTWTLATGFRTEGVYVDGTKQTGTYPNNNYTFEDVNANHTFKVVCERIPAPEPPAGVFFTVSTSINKGTISGDQNIAEGGSCVVSWQIPDGFYTESIKVNGRAVTIPAGTDIATLRQWTIDNIYAATKVEVSVAEEEVEPEPDKFNVDASIVGGTLNCAMRQTVESGQDVNVSWTPEVGYYVDSVTVDGQKVDPCTSYKFEGVTDNHEIKIVCLLTVLSSTYLVNLSSTHATFNKESAELPVGTDYEVSWTPEDGYHVTSVEIDGVTQSDVDEAGGTHTFTGAKADSTHSIKVVAEKDPEPEPEPEPGEVKLYKVSTEIENGGTIRTIPDVLRGSDVLIDWTLAPNYKVSKVLLDGEELTGDFSSNSYTIENVTANHSFKVVCEFVPPVEPELPDVYYTVTTEINAGTISCNPSVVEADGTSTVSWTVPTGYTTTALTVNGVAASVQAADRSYALNNINADTKVVVTVTPPVEPPQDKYAYINISINGGTITSDSMRPKVKLGSDCTVTWTPNDGYFVDDVTVDGSSVGVCTSYAFKNVTKDVNLAISCKPSAVSETYFVTVSGKNATIDNPSAEVPILTDYTVSWTPTTGYHTSKLVIDGAEQTVTDAMLKGGSYTFHEELKGEIHTFAVECEKDEEIVPPTTEGYNISTQIQNGTITGSFKVNAGEDATVSWKPDYGCIVKKVLIDDVEVSDEYLTWTFKSVDKKHSVQVICAIPDAPEPDPEATYTIETSINLGGRITAPITVSTAEQKKTQTVSWSASEGNRVASVTVNGVERADLKDAGTATFTNIDRNIKVVVKCEAIPVPVKYNIAASIENGEFTSTIVPVTKGKDFTVKWKGATGFVFDKILVDGADAVCDEGKTTQYTFKNMAADHTIKVIYKYVEPPTPPAKNQYTISTSIDNGGQITTGSVVEEGKDFTVEWSVKDGYRVKTITIDGSEVDKNTMSKAFTAVNASHSVAVATEKIPTYTITTDGQNVSNLTPTITNIAEGATKTISWSVPAGFEIKVVMIDGVADDLTLTSKTFTNIHENHSVSIACQKIAVPEPPLASYIISTSISGGTISGGGEIQAGKTQTVSWTPSKGYEVTSVIVDNSPMVVGTADKQGGQVTFSTITANHTVSVECKEIGAPAKQYVNINTTIKGGKLTKGESLAQVEVGTDYVVSWEPALGYEVTSVELDGASREDLIDAGTLTFGKASINHTLIITCREKGAEPEPEVKTYTINTKATNGTISDPFTTQEEGKSYKVTWSALAGYEVTRVEIDGSENAQALADGYVQFDNIKASHTVDVTCTLQDITPNMYNVTATITNGTISTSPLQAAAGSSITATWAPKLGFKVSTVTIDGKSYGNAFNGEYTFEDIQANHTVEVICVPDEPVMHKVTVKLAGGNGAEITPSMPQVEHGTNATVSWKAKEGWRITGVTFNSQPLSLDEVNAGSKTVAVYADAEFVISVAEQGSQTDLYHFVETSIVNGRIDSIGSVAKGSDVVVNFSALNGYELSSGTLTFKDGTSRDITRAELGSGKLTIQSISQDATVRVVCTKSQDPTLKYYTVNKTISNGTFVKGAETINAGENETYEYTPSANCHVEQVEVVKYLSETEKSVTTYTRGGGNLPANNELTLSAVANNYDINVDCEPDQSSVPGSNKYNVTTSISNGVINGPFIHVQRSDKVTINWTPAEGYEVTKITDNGKDITAEVNGARTYVLSVGGDDHSFVVTCAEIPPIPPEKTTYTIDAKMYDGEGCRFTSPSTVAEGENLTVSWALSPDNHYRIASIYVDNVQVPIPADNCYLFRDVHENHKVDIYLEQNVVDITVTSEGESSSVSPTKSVFIGDDYTVEGVPATGWKVFSVKVDGKTYKAGTKIPAELLPDGASQPATGVCASKFQFRDVSKAHDVHFVFSKESGEEPEYAPYLVSTKLIGGMGDATNKKVVPNGSATLTWNFDSSVYYIDKLTVYRNGNENELADVPSVVWDGTSNSVTASNVMTDTEIRIYLKRGEKPAPEDIMDIFSLSGEFKGPGANAVGNEFKYNTFNLLPGEHSISWQVAQDHVATMVEVDGVQKPALINDSGEVTVNMNLSDSIKDHEVVVTVDSNIKPKLTNTATSTGKVGENITFKTEVWNEAADAIWKNVNVTDVIPEGLTLDESSIKLEKVTTGNNVRGLGNSLLDFAASGAKSNSVLDVSQLKAAATPSYDASTRTISANVGDLIKGYKYVLTFTALINDDSIDRDYSIANSVGAVGQSEVANGDVSLSADSKYKWNALGTPIPKAPTPYINQTVTNDYPDNPWTHVGDILHYDIDISNVGAGSKWNNVNIRDILSAGLEYVPSTLQVIKTDENGEQTLVRRDKDVFDSANNIFKIPLEDLLNGRTYKIKFDAVVLDSAIGTDIGNKVEASGINAAKESVNVATDTVYPRENDKPENDGTKRHIELQLEGVNETNPGGSIAYGDVIAYDLTVTNHEDAITWTNVVVTADVSNKYKIKPDYLWFTMPDGSNVQLRVEDIYDETTHELKATLPGELAPGESCVLHVKLDVVGAKESTEELQNLVALAVVHASDASNTVFAADQVEYTLPWPQERPEGFISGQTNVVIDYEHGSEPTSEYAVNNTVLTANVTNPGGTLKPRQVLSYQWQKLVPAPPEPEPTPEPSPEPEPEPEPTPDPDDPSGDPDGSGDVSDDSSTDDGSGDASDDSSDDTGDDQGDHTGDDTGDDTPQEDDGPHPWDPVEPVHEDMVWEDISGATAKELHLNNLHTKDDNGTQYRCVVTYKNDTKLPVTRNLLSVKLNVSDFVYVPASAKILPMTGDSISWQIVYGTIFTFGALVLLGTLCHLCKKQQEDE